MSSNISFEGPLGHRLQLTETFSTNATTSTNAGPGQTVDRILGTLGRGFEDIVGRAAHKLGFGPAAAGAKIEEFEALICDNSSFNCRKLMLSEDDRLCTKGPYGQCCLETRRTLDTILIDNPSLGYLKLHCSNAISEEQRKSLEFYCQRLLKYATWSESSKTILQALWIMQRLVKRCVLIQDCFLSLGAQSQLGQLLEATQNNCCHVSDSDEHQECLSLRGACAAATQSLLKTPFSIEESLAIVSRIGRTRKVSTKSKGSRLFAILEKYDSSSTWHRNELESVCMWYLIQLTQVRSAVLFCKILDDLFRLAAASPFARHACYKMGVRVPGSRIKIADMTPSLHLKPTPDQETASHINDAVSQLSWLFEYGNWQQVCTWIHDKRSWDYVSKMTEGCDDTWFVKWVKRWDGMTLWHIFMDFRLGRAICYTEGTWRGYGHGRLHVFVEKQNGMLHDIISVFDTIVVGWVRYAYQNDPESRPTIIDVPVGDVHPMTHVLAGVRADPPPPLPYETLISYERDIDGAIHWFLFKEGTSSAARSISDASSSTSYGSELESPDTLGHLIHSSDGPEWGYIEAANGLTARRRSEG